MECRTQLRDAFTLDGQFGRVARDVCESFDARCFHDSLLENGMFLDAGGMGTGGTDHGL